MTAQNKILIIGTVWPEPTSSAAGTRMMQLIDAFKNEATRMVFASAATDSEFAIDLSKHDIETQKIELNSESFDVFLNELKPDVVLFDRFITEEQYGWRVSKNCPDALRILDTEDLHGLRHARTLTLKNNQISFWEALINEVSLREIAAIYRCDLSLIISDFEMELLHTFYKIPESLLHYIPFMYEPLANEFTDKWKTFEQRRHFIAIGNFLHEPNRNATVVLKEEIWPLIRKSIPDAELHIYGAYPSQQILQMHNVKEGFIVKGRVENALEVLEGSRVNLAPLRIGAGIKGKLADGMLTGTPSVTTTIGAEGMHGGMDWNGIVCDNPEDFASAAVKLYASEKLWIEMQKNGIALINSLFLKSKHQSILLDKTFMIKNNLKSHRLSNFTGAMLMHHNMQSTKYMSRWIEAKSKLSSK